MIKDVDGRFDDYSILPMIMPMIRQVYCIGAMNWLEIIYNLFFVHVKMSYCQLK